jgi:hypothetical protein
MSETDRFCRACGQSQSGATAGRYEPGPSFVDDSLLQVDPIELPPWLREMTAASADGPESFGGSTSSAVAQNDVLPTWLDAATPTNGASSPAGRANPGLPKSAARPNEESMAEFSLISEDDLPEWLRALGDQEFELDPTPAPSTNGVVANVPPTTIVAPTIRRAWLNRPRTVESETAEQVASDFAPIEANASVGAIRRATSTSSAPATSIDATQSLPVTAPAPVATEKKMDSRRMRLVSLSVLVVILVLIVFYALSNLL